MNRAGFAIAAAISIGVAVLSPTPSSAAQSNIPQLTVSFSSTVTVIDRGYSVPKPPANAQVASAPLAKLCSNKTGEEIRIESDGKTLAVGTTKVLKKPTPTPKRIGIDVDGSKEAAGYVAYEGSCVVGIKFKKVPAAAFYQVFEGDTKLGTYSAKQLKSKKFNLSFKELGGQCDINSMYEGFFDSCR